MINEEDVAAIWVSLDRLKEWKDNPRKNEEAVGPVAKSIKECGFGSPIVARLANGEIINGHTRFKASRDILKLDRVPVRFLDISEDDAHELALRDNKTGEIAGWDNDLLAKINREHQNIDLSKIGWTDEDVNYIENLDNGTFYGFDFEEDDVGEIEDRTQLKEKDTIIKITIPDKLDNVFEVKSAFIELSKKHNLSIEIN